MNEYLTMEVHNEYSKRMDDEHKRISHRISELEKTSAQNNKLLVAVERLAASMESMQREMQEQGKRITSLESRDGEMWRTIIKYAVTVLVSALIGFGLSKIGL